MWGRRTEQSRGLDDRLIENARKSVGEEPARQAKTDHGAACRMDVQCRLYMLDAACLFLRASRVACCPTESTWEMAQDHHSWVHERDG